MSIFLPVFGLPSVFTSWFVNLAVTISKLFYDDCEYITANSANEFKTQLINRRHNVIVFHSDCPMNSISNIFVNGAFPYILVLERADRCYLEAMQDRGLSPLSATRFITQSICTTMNLKSGRHVFLVDSSWRHLKLFSVIRMLCDHYQLPLTDEGVAHVCRFMIPVPEEGTTLNQSIDHLFGARATVPFLDAKDGFKPFIDLYENFLKENDIGILEWPLAALSRFPPNRNDLNDSIELVGPARILIGGHALHLPVGYWEATLTIRVDGNKSGNIIQSDVLCSDLPAGVVRFDLPPSGRFKFSIKFFNREAFYPVQVRLYSIQGSIEGTLSVECIQMEREGSVGIANLLGDG